MAQEGGVIFNALGGYKGTRAKVFVLRFWHALSLRATARVVVRVVYSSVHAAFDSFPAQPQDTPPPP